MTLHNDLLKQAHHLATKEPRRPIQASLRRSISTSCYALFHRLVDEASRMMISRGNHKGLRECLARAFRHSDMKQLCVALGGGNPPQKLSAAFQPPPLDPRLVSIARAFLELQEARHRADYNTYQPLTRQEALHSYQLCVAALSDWDAIRKTPQGDSFLAGLLIIQRVQA